VSGLKKCRGKKVALLTSFCLLLLLCCAPWQCVG
jgi:hypothetical protein